jgi:hypothetical protein
LYTTVLRMRKEAGVDTQSSCGLGSRHHLFSNDIASLFYKAEFGNDPHIPNANCTAGFYHALYLVVLQPIKSVHLRLP